MSCFFQINKDVIDCIVTATAADRQICSPALQAKVVRETGINISRRTVRDLRFRLGFRVCMPRDVPIISEPNAQKRVEFCRRTIAAGERFENVLFTDECTVQLEHHSRFCFRSVNDDGTLGPRPFAAKAKHPFKVNVWGGISWKGQCPIAYFKVNMNSIVYIDILRRVYKPYAVSLFQNHIIMILRYYDDCWPWMILRNCLQCMILRDKYNTR